MKVRCIKGNTREKYFTVGKIYDLLDGKITDDTGHVYGIGWSTSNEEMLDFLNTAYKFADINIEKITIFHNGNTVTALNECTKEKGIAKCNPSDTFDLYTGSRLALDRLFGKEIPQVREVNRKAKKGEWVKIVKAEFVPVNDDGTPSYKNGDVLHIISDVGYGYVRFREGEDRSNKRYILAQSEYVVLENYTPTEEVKELVKETFYNGKVVCIKAVPHSSFTVGKVYQFVDGSVTDDIPHTYTGIHDFEQWQRGSKGHTEWMEVTEEQSSNKFYNGRVMCLEPNGHPYYTKGKIYQFSDGYIVFDNGEYCSKRYSSFEALKSWSSCVWLEIKE